MINVWFIRHGESASNAGLATEATQTVQLTEKGHTQARKAALAFEQAPTLIVTSRYMRAIQTAQYTIDRFPNVPVETWDVHEFTYLSFAAIGKTTLEERRPIVQDYWDRADPAYVHGEDAESFDHFVQRVKKLEEQICAIDNRSIAVFGHGFVMKMNLWANILGASASITMSNFRAFQKSFDIPNGGIVKAEYHPGKQHLFSGVITDHLK